MKPKITKQDLAQLNKMNKGAFHINTEAIETACKNASESLLRLQETIDSLPKRKSLFERFYDYIGNILSGGKSFAPAELKGFR